MGYSGFDFSGLDFLFVERINGYFLKGWESDAFGYLVGRFGF